MTPATILLMQDIRLVIIAQLRSLPCNVEGWWIIGPTPLARTMHQAKNVIPAVGATIALRAKRRRLAKRQSQCGRSIENGNELHFVHRKPDGRERHEPEEEEAHKVPGIGAG